MNQVERDARRQAARLPRIQQRTQAEILRQLELARRIILGVLAGEISTGRRRQLEALQLEVASAMRTFGVSAGSAAVRGVNAAWASGLATVAGPLRMFPGGASINTRTLLAMREFLTGRIKDISRVAVDRINTTLAQALIGTLTQDEAISRVQQVLDGSTRRRAMNIVYTQLGQAHSAATYAAMLEKVKIVPELQKRWLRSGKRKPRPTHFAYHNTIVPVEQPFEIRNPKTRELEQLRYPRDPKTSPENTINCGCIMVPSLPGSKYGAGVVAAPTRSGERPRVISPEARLADTEQLLDRVADRLRRAGLDDGGVTLPVRIMTSSTAVGIAPIDATEAAIQITLLMRDPKARSVVVGVTSSAVARGIGARSSEVVLTPYTRKKQLAHHADVDIADYANAPAWISQFEVAVRDGRSVYLFERSATGIWQTVLSPSRDGAVLLLRSRHRVRAAALRRYRRLKVIDGKWWDEG